MSQIITLLTGLTELISKNISHSHLGVNETSSFMSCHSYSAYSVSFLPLFCCTSYVAVAVAAIVALAVFFFLDFMFLSICSWVTEIVELM